MVECNHAIQEQILNTRWKNNFSSEPTLPSMNVLSLREKKTHYIPDYFPGIHYLRENTTVPKWRFLPSINEGEIRWNQLVIWLWNSIWPGVCATLACPCVRALCLFPSPLSDTHEKLPLVFCTWHIISYNVASVVACVHGKKTTSIGLCWKQGCMKVYTLYFGRTV